MEEIIQWLMKIEHLANDIYSRAAIYFHNNLDLKQFLNHAAEDETMHYHIMTSAAQHYQTRPPPLLSIALDTETRDRIEGIFKKISEQIVDQSLSEKILLDSITTTEFSEWNDIFLYVVSNLKEQVDEFKYVLAKIQSHKRYIEAFLEGSEQGRESLRRLLDIPAVWKENILIVDDEAIVAELFKALLQREGNIDTATNGQEALEKINGKYYKLIISDIDMPIMDGVSFYRHAVEIFPPLKDRFLFITGNVSQGKLDFFQQNNLKFLSKPAPITTMRNEALKFLLK
jgi:two-component system, chemotaxis family, chemotaxis protein CheY